MTKHKKYGFKRIMVYSLFISFISLSLDWIWHKIIFEAIQGKPHSPSPYWIAKFFVGLIIPFIFLILFKKLNILIKSIIIGIASALFFAGFLMVYYSGIYGASSNYGFLMHSAHSIAFFIATYLTIKMGDKIG